MQLLTSTPAVSLFMQRQTVGPLARPPGAMKLVILDRAGQDQHEVQTRVPQGFDFVQGPLKKSFSRQCKAAPLRQLHRAHVPLQKVGEMPAAGTRACM